MTQGKIEGSRRSVAARLEFTGEVAALAARNGYDLNRTLNTIEGDDVYVIAVDTGHIYPIVGEVIDYNAGISWLARWDEQGVYRGSPDAQLKHSFERNTPLYHGLTRNQTPPDLGDLVKHVKQTAGVITPLGRFYMPTVEKAADKPLSPTLTLTAKEFASRLLNREPPAIVGAALSKQPVRPQLQADVAESIVPKAVDLEAEAADYRAEREFEEGFREATQRRGKNVVFSPFYEMLCKAALTHSIVEVTALAIASKFLLERGRIVLREGAAEAMDYDALLAVVKYLVNHPGTVAEARVNG